MTKKISIADGFLTIDPQKTEQYYLTLRRIVDDCSCEDCQYYVTKCIQEPFEIFSMLSAAGVDLAKNLPEPPGVWTIVYNNQFIFCQQTYRAVGKVLPADKSKLNYEKTESGYKIEVIFTQEKGETISIDLMISKE